MKDKQNAYQLICELVARFKKNEAEYIKDSYLEMSVRSNFIDLFFEALNWDVYGKKMLPVGECEVIREEHVSEENSKRVDYAFRVNGAVNFIVEAKKPSENIDNPRHIFQLKSYAFSMGVNLAVLTNFREFRVYDLKSKPLFNQPKEDCIEDFSICFEQYPSDFEKIWRLFEYENVLKGSIKKFYFDNRRGMSQAQIEEALRTYNKKGSSLLDKAFLQDLLVWRERLAKSIFCKNNTINQYSLNEVVQRYIDRIIFLRIVEDRGIEDKEILRQICEKWLENKDFSLSEELEKSFVLLNTKYNGMLFKSYAGFKNIIFEDQVICDFILSLYVPNSPYNFAVIDIDILGKIFEQYLGYTILLEDNDVILELKTENKKNAGVYYTRHEIVDKIVEESIEIPLEKFNKLDDLEQFKVLDMACGSGTFLIEAYRKIVERYEEIIKKYLQEGKSIPNNYYFMDDGNVHLTMSLKKEIAVNNIYGVDIDAQAIEVAKMSMYILMLELNYKDDTVRPILPTLEKNFKVGNSIIANDYYEINDVDLELDRVINPFDYNIEFSDVFINGGFDCIIGNPPYIKIQTLNSVYPQPVIEYINDKYSDTAKGNYDISVVFLEKALNLLKDNGYLGMITLKNFMNSSYGVGLRRVLSENKYVYNIVDFGDIQVFEHSRVYTCLLFLRKKSNDTFLYDKVVDYGKWMYQEKSKPVKFNSTILTSKPWVFPDDVIYKSIMEACEGCPRIKNIADVFAGVQPLTNSIYLLRVVGADEKYEYCVRADKKDEIIYKLEKDSLKKLVKGSRDIKKYGHATDKRLIFPYEIIDGKAKVICEEKYKERFPETYNYLLNFKEQLKCKHTEVSEEKPWYRYAYNKNHTKFEQAKIMAPAMMYGSRFSYDEKDNIYMTCGGASSGGGNAITLLEDCDSYTYNALLAILNSSLVSYMIIHDGVPKTGGWQGIDKSFLEEIAIPFIGDNVEKKQLLDVLNKLVISLDKVLKSEAKSESDEERRKRRIESMLMQIDENVYKLYGINNELHLSVLSELKNGGYLDF